jgi:serine/threonine protein kinase
MHFLSASLVDSLEQENRAEKEMSATNSVLAVERERRSTSPSNPETVGGQAYGLEAKQESAEKQSPGDIESVVGDSFGQEAAFPAAGSAQPSERGEDVFGLGSPDGSIMSSGEPCLQPHGFGTAPSTPQPHPTPPGHLLLAPGQRHSAPLVSLVPNSDLSGMAVANKSPTGPDSSVGGEGGSLSSHSDRPVVFAPRQKKKPPPLLGNLTPTMSGIVSVLNVSFTGANTPNQPRPASVYVTLTSDTLTSGSFVVNRTGCVSNPNPLLMNASFTSDRRGYLPPSQSFPDKTPPLRSSNRVEVVSPLVYSLDEMKATGFSPCAPEASGAFPQGGSPDGPQNNARVLVRPTDGFMLPSSVVSETFLQQHSSAYPNPQGGGPSPMAAAKDRAPRSTTSRASDSDYRTASNQSNDGRSPKSGPLHAMSVMSPGRHPLEGVVEGARYQLHFEDLTMKERIGSGASGSVFRAVHNVTNKNFAVKVVDLSLIWENQNTPYERLSEKVKQQHHIVHRELQVLHCHYRSPYLLKTYDAFYLGNDCTLNIVMEYMDFGNLEDLGRHFWKQQQFYQNPRSPSSSAWSPTTGDGGSAATSTVSTPHQATSPNFPTSENQTARVQDGERQQSSASVGTPSGLGSATTSQAALQRGKPNSGASSFCSSNPGTLGSNANQSATTSTKLHKRNPVPERAVCVIAEQVLSALKEMHEKNHIHRDIKPQNILVNRSGSVRVSDFGLAELRSSTPFHGVLNLDPIEGEDEVRCSGTNRYMSPERQRGEPHGAAADVWGLGVTLAECALGRYPFDIEDCQGPFEVMAVINRGIAFTQEDKELLTPKFLDLIQKMTDPDPKQRPTTGDLLLHEVFAQWPGTYDLGKELTEALPLALAKAERSRVLGSGTPKAQGDGSPGSATTRPLFLKMVAEGAGEDQAKEAARFRRGSKDFVKGNLGRRSN